MIPGTRRSRLHHEFHLGGWFHIPVFRKWPWRYAPANGYLHRWSPAGWTEFRPTHDLTRTIRFRAHLNRSTEAPPGVLHLASVTRNSDNTFTLDNSCPSSTSFPPADAFRDPLCMTHTRTLQDCLATAVSDSRVLLDDIACTDATGHLLAEALRNGTTSAVSDGSYRDDIQRGSAAFIVSERPEGAVTASMAIGCNLTTGLPEDQSSYRSKLTGILGILSFMDILC